MNIDWVKEFQGAVTLSDEKGIIIYMNDKASKSVEKYGGMKLIGKSLFDCHGEESSKKLKELLKTQTNNIYTVEKAGIKKLIYQSPWYENENFKGILEISLEIPFEMNHFVREG